MSAATGGTTTGSPASLLAGVGAGYCNLELLNLSQRVQDLFKLTKLMEMFSS